MNTPITRISFALLLFSLSGCGSPIEPHAAQSPSTARGPSTTKLASKETPTRTLRPHEAPIQIEQAASEPGRLTLFIKSAHSMTITDAKVWAVDGAQVLDVAPNLRGLSLDPAQPLSIQVDYRLDSVRGRVVVALQTGEQPNSRRVVQSFTVGEPLPLPEASNPTKDLAKPSGATPERFHRLPAARK